MDGKPAGRTGMLRYPDGFTYGCANGDADGYAHCESNGRPDCVAH